LIEQNASIFLVASEETIEAQPGDSQS